MEFSKVVRAAIGDSAKQVREELRHMGKSVDVQQVYRQCKPSNDVLRRNFYEQFWMWFVAIWRANRKGAELLIADLLSRLFRLQHRGSLDPNMLTEILRRRERERWETADAIFKGDDWDLIEREILEDRAEDEFLLAWVREHRSNLASMPLRVAA